MTTTPLSVVIITLNAGRSLAVCLESVAFADDIVVVDSGSTDETLEIAQRYHARIMHQDFLGFGKQKQFAVEQAVHDWVLCLDADERVSEALCDSIHAVMSAPQQDAYRMARCNRFLGRWLRHGEGYPDYKVRLFNRTRAHWSDDAVHEYVVIKEEPGTLQGDLLHESEEGIADYLTKQNRYTTLQAEKLYAQGKRVGLLQLLLSPVLRFFKFYVLRRGFLDGIPGLIHIAIGCGNSFLKYAKVIEMHLSDKK